MVLHSSTGMPLLMRIRALFGFGASSRTESIEVQIKSADYDDEGRHKLANPRSDDNGP